MRKFRFRLESVEKVRKTRETQALGVVGIAQHALSNEKNKKSDLLIELDRALLERETLASKESDINELKVVDQFIVGHKQRITRAEVAIKKAEKNVERAMQAYLAAKRAYMVIETLRDRDLVDFK